jgi:ABC-type cobalamin/Fe3+-siderophores transport system ATPase subunit
VIESHSQLGGIDMENNDKITLALKVASVLKTLNQNIQSHINFISSHIEPNKEFIIDLLIKENNNNTEKQDYENFIAIKPQFKDINISIQKLIESLEQEQNTDLTFHYIKLIHDTFASENMKFNNHQYYTEKILNNIKGLRGELKDPNKLKDFRKNFGSFFTALKNLDLNLFASLSAIENFKYVKDIKNNIVIIGANGSGKTSFSRHTQQILGDNIVIIPAQKILNYQNPKKISQAKQSVERVHNYQKKIKKFDDRFLATELLNDLQNLIDALISQHTEIATKFYQESKIREVGRQASILESVIEIWNQINTHREIHFDYSESNLSISTQKQKYDFNMLSDGEKAIFYYVAHTLIAKEHSYIIIDEPENHLHLSIISHLWNKLESIREDCQFIYLTHNLDFASSRINANKLWSKKYTPPSEWDIEPLPDKTIIPEALIMQLLGSRKSILFCEGEKDSKDYRLYTILFPHFLVTPVKGHEQVIDYTQAFNKLKEITGNSAIGIIDGDFFTEEQIAKYRKKKIYVISVQEVENILCDDLLLEQAKIKYDGEYNSIEEGKNRLFNEFYTQKEKQAVKYTTQYINNKMKENMLEEGNSIEDLNNFINELACKLKPKEIYEERLKKYQNAIDAKEYSEALKLFHNKGIIGIVPIYIEKDYSRKVFSLLANDNELIKKLRKKYFGDIELQHDTGMNTLNSKK